MGESQKSKSKKEKEKLKRKVLKVVVESQIMQNKIINRRTDYYEILEII